MQKDSKRLRFHLFVTSESCHQYILGSNLSIYANKNRRKEWLRSNELLLRTFLSYCYLNIAKGGGLTSIKMELALVMQELIEDRSMKQLLLPVPVSTTIPLLSACVAGSKNLIAGPKRIIKSIVTEILRSISSIQQMPTTFDNSVIILTVKDQSLSLRHLFISVCVIRLMSLIVRS